MDAAREYTDREIRRVARDLAMDYGREGDAAASKVMDFLTERAVDGVVPESALQGRDWARLRSEVARQMSDRNRASAEAIGGRMGTVRDLTAGDAPAESRVPHPAIDRRRDLTWNERHVEAAARAAVGKDPSVAAKGVRGLADMNRNAAVRRARTAINGAENAGRMDAMLARGGSKRWVAVMDERTRVSHASINGEVVPVDEPFSNGLMYPGDPSGPPEEVCNCRCTMERVDTFDSQPEELPQKWEMAEGQDILGTWQRRPDEYDFEIEDVIAAQGFDGKPRVVDADEFDQAVRQANGGDGLIMQRTYSAPDQATLDAYRDQLYHGKWYVDCSTGGAQYGQGMYAAADYTGKLSDGIKEEMQHYISLNESRGAEHAYVETMTLDPSAKIIRYADIDAEFARAEADSFLGVVKKANPRLTDREAAAVVRECGGTRSGSTFKLAKSWEREDPDGYDAFIEALGKAWDEYKDAIEEVRLATASLDDGSKAAAMGYDAINAEGHGASGSYTVVLNRTKLIIRRPE